MGTLKDKIVETVKEFFKDAISIPFKIKFDVPDIPFFGGDGPGMGATSGSANLMGAGAHLQPFANLGASMGLQVTSGFRPGAVTNSGNRSYHASRRAIDVGGPQGAMLRFANAMLAFQPRLKELIHTPMGAGVWNGQRHVYTGQTAADHYDHVHVAMAGGGHVRRGGWAVVGERGPELAHLPSRSNVYSNADSRAILGGGDTVVKVYIDGVQIEQSRVVFERERASRLAYGAGVT